MDGAAVPGERNADVYFSGLLTVNYYNRKNKIAVMTVWTAGVDRQVMKSKHAVMFNHFSTGQRYPCIQVLTAMEETPLQDNVAGVSVMLNIGAH